MKVSVIIPVFNAEDYLEECIDSVLKQSYSDFEILLINDGSTDSSASICTKYASNDNRIKVFTQQNSGVSSARNVGIENAKGEWITFVDSDDTIQQRYFDLLEVNSETDWIHVDMSRQIPSSMPSRISFEDQFYTVQDFISRYSLYPDFPEACGKFFKREFIIVNNLKFDEDLKFGEDSVFNLKYLKFCKTVSTSNIAKYEYRNEAGVLSKLNYNVRNDLKLFSTVEKELRSDFFPGDFCVKTIKIPLARYLKVLYYDSSLPRARRIKLLRKTIEKYYEVVLEIYSHPKIRPFIIMAYYFKAYIILDSILKKLNK